MGACVHAFDSASQGDPKTPFLDWLGAQHPTIPEVIEKSSRYASLYSAEAAFCLLERQNCSHVAELADPKKIMIDRHCRDGSSDAMKLAARRVASEYWVSHGYEDAQIQACTGLVKV